MDKKHAHMDPQVMAELIRRYFAGELDDMAMHALEKQALSDPFLAEALEGFEQHPADQRAQLASLDAHLQERGAGNVAVGQPLAPALQEKSLVKMRRRDYRWAAAAAVLLLAVVGSYQWLHTNNDTSQTKIVQEVPRTDPSTVPAPAPTVPTATGSDSNLAVIAAAPALKKPAAPVAATAKSAAGTDSIPAADETYFDRISTPVAASGESRRMAAAIPGMEVSKDSGAGLPAFKRTHTVADSSVARFEKNGNSGLVVKGRVVDEKGTPLPGVVVRYKGASAAVQTKADGLFSLPVNGSDAREVALRYVGFKKIDTLLYASNEVKDVILKQDTDALNEVVVMGYGANPAGTPDAGYKKPRPEAGYDSLQRYLDKSLPANGTSPVKIRVTFIVTPAGKLENFRILKGVSDLVDQQVIELLKEGPAWKPASDARPAQVKLVVKVPAPHQ